MKGRSRKKRHQAKRPIAVLTVAAVCAVGGITALGGSTPALVEPLNIEGGENALCAVVDTSPIVIRIECEETEPVAVIEPETEAETEPEALFRATSTGTSLSASDQTALMKIAMAEAEDQGTKGMALVMRVVLNRVASKSWPNSVEGVITQKGQFTPVSNGRYYKMTPNAQAREALNMVMNGWDESQGAQYFCMAGSSKWHANHLTRLFQYKDHVFYR